jgi:hypothetical protein
MPDVHPRVTRASRRSRRARLRRRRLLAVLALALVVVAVVAGIIVASSAGSAGRATKAPAGDPAEISLTAAGRRLMRETVSRSWRDSRIDEAALRRLVRRAVAEKGLSAALLRIDLLKLDIEG